MLRVLLAAIWTTVQIADSAVTVSWELDTSIGSSFEPQFDKSVRLVCKVNGTSCCPNSASRKWKVQQNNIFIQILANGVSANSSKYVEELQESANQFNLIIKNFDTDDANIQYQCQYNFAVDTKPLQLADGISYIPSSSEIVEITNDFDQADSFSYVVNITKVYPGANCSCVYDNHDLTADMTTSTGDNGVFKYVVLSLSNVAHECSGEFSIICAIGLYENQHIANFTPCGNGGGDNCIVLIIIMVFVAVSVIVMVITLFVVLLLSCKFPGIGKVVIIVSSLVIDVLFEIIMLWGIEYGSNLKYFRSDSECNVVLIGIVCHLVTLLIEVVKAGILYRYMNKLKKRFFGISPEGKPTGKVPNDVVDRKARSNLISNGSEDGSPPSAEDRKENEAKPEHVMILMYFTIPEGYLVDTWATEKTLSINDTSKYRPSDRGSLCIKAATETDNGIYQSILKSKDSEQRINAVLHVTEQKSVSLVIHPLIWRRLTSKKLKKMSELKDVRIKLSTKKIDDIEMKKEDKSNVSVKSVRWKHNGRGIPSNYNKDDKEVPPLEVMKKDPIDEYHCTVEFSNKKSHVYIFIVKFTGARSGNTQSSDLAKNKVDTTEHVIGVPTIMNTKSEDIAPDLPPIRHTGTTAPANQNPESSPVQGSDLHPVTARSAQSTATEGNT